VPGHSPYLKAEDTARVFYDTYAARAPLFVTPKPVPVPWPELPLQRRMLLVDVVQELLDAGAIR
jgi:hypothetical protein